MPLYVKIPDVKLVGDSFNTLNNTQKVEIDWSESFELNGPLSNYIVKINNQTRYKGFETFYNQEFILECNPNLKSEFFVDKSIQKINYLYVQVEAVTTIGNVESEIKKVDFNCPGNILKFLFY